MPKVSTEHKQRRREEILEGATAPSPGMATRAQPSRGWRRRPASRAARSSATSRQGGALHRRRRAGHPSGSSRSGSNVASGRCSRRSCTRTRSGCQSRSRRPGESGPRALPRADRAARRRVEDASAHTLRAPASFGPRGHPDRVTLQFLSFVANGLAIARTTGDELPDLDLLNELRRVGVGRRCARSGQTNQQSGRAWLVLKSTQALIV